MANIFTRMAIGARDPGFFARQRQQEEELEFQRQQSILQQQGARNQQTVQAAMQVLDRAPVGSNARAAAIAALGNAGMSDQDLLNALQEVGPKVGGRKVERVGRSLVEVPPTGPVQELFRGAPTTTPTSTEGERNLQRILELETKEDLTQQEELELRFRQERREARNQPDPMKRFMAQMLGAPQPVRQLDRAQQDAVKRAKAAIDRGNSPTKIKDILRNKYGLTTEQLEAEGL